MGKHMEDPVHVSHGACTCVCKQAGELCISVCTASCWMWTASCQWWRMCMCQRLLIYHCRMDRWWKTPPHCHHTLHVICTKHLLYGVGLHIRAHQTHITLDSSLTILEPVWRHISYYHTKKALLVMLSSEILWNVMCAGNSGLLGCWSL